MLHAATTAADLPHTPAPRTLSSRSSLNEPGGNRSVVPQILQREAAGATAHQGRRAIAGSPSVIPPFRISKLELSISRPHRLALTAYPGFTHSRIIGRRNYPYLRGSCWSCSQTCTPLVNFRLQMSRYNKMRVALFQRSRSQLPAFLLPAFSFSPCLAVHIAIDLVDRYINHGGRNGHHRYYRYCAY